MATLTLQGSIPPIRLVPGMQLRLEAVNATSGAVVTGVVATRWAIYGDAVTELALDDGDLPSWVPDGDQEVV